MDGPTCQLAGHSNKVEGCCSTMTAAAVAPVVAPSDDFRSAGDGASALPASNVHAPPAHTSTVDSARIIDFGVEPGRIRAKCILDVLGNDLE